jgi:hypothetical protein
MLSWLFSSKETQQKSSYRKSALKTLKTKQVSATDKNKKTSKKSIPSAIRQQVWLTYNGKKYETDCYVSWCKNKITCFNFHVGHDIPESKAGTLHISNLRPICSNCNLSMGNKYSIKEWNATQDKPWNWTSLPWKAITSTTTVVVGTGSYVAYGVYNWMYPPESSSWFS